MVCSQQLHPIGKVLHECFEKLSVQVGVRAMFRDRILVTRDEEIQMFTGNVVAMMPLKGNVLFNNPAPFAKDVFTFF